MERRRARRFDIRRPLAFTTRDSARLSVEGLTTNISAHGVLFTSEWAPDVGSPIQYVITLNDHGSQDLKLRCVGRVLRAEQVESGGEERPTLSQIAVTLERYEFVNEGTARTR